MLALWVALGAVIALVLLLVVVLVVQSVRGRRQAWAEPEILTLDPGPPAISERSTSIAHDLVALDRALAEVRTRLDAVRGARPGDEVGPAGRQRAVDEAFQADATSPEVWATVSGLGERIGTDLEEATAALVAARGRWAGLDRQPLGRRAVQAREVLDEADLLVSRLLAAQSAWLRHSVLRIRRAVASGDLAATAVAEDALEEVRRMLSLGELRREVDDLLENLDLTTRADRLLHPRLARDREGTGSVRAEVADRPWVSAPDLLARPAVRASAPNV